MRSYLDILNELTKTIDTDVMPEAEKEAIKEQIQVLFDLLWKYSD